MRKFILAVCMLICSISMICLVGSQRVSGEYYGKVISISVHTYPTKTVYGAFEQIDSTGLAIKAVYESGDEKIIRGDSIEVFYMQDDCFRVGDGGVVLSYGGRSITLPITVNRISYDLTSLDLSDFSVTYNGRYQSYNNLMPSIVGLDGIPLTISAVGGSVNAGSYDIKVDFFSDSKDYILPDSRVITMTVLPREEEIVWGETSFVYDGKTKLPEGYYYDVYGNKVYLTLSGAAINAGKYTAKIVSSDPNYKLKTDKISFEIKKADYDLSSVKWSEDSFIYDGSQRSITVSGLPDGVRVIGYTGDRAINAGVYTVTASLQYDERNYNTPGPVTHQWKIDKAYYDMSVTKFVDTEYAFDGEIHYPMLVGAMPTGLDGITLEYSFSAGATHVSDGVVEVIISFTTESTNYRLPQSQKAKIKIISKGINVLWSDSSVYYNGKSQQPTAISDECEIRVKGSGLNAGSYRITAYTENSDYHILNDTLEYKILKAENTWRIEPGDSSCYEGKTITLVGEAMFGKAKYIYYADKEGKERISAPGSCGVYYAKIYISDTENYYGIESDIVCLEILKIAPVSFYVTLENKELKAYQMLSAKDFISYIVNNDGSVERVDSALVTVIYENGDSFRRADTTVYLNYLGFESSVSVEVDYADYDLSGIYWDNATVEYDGTAKSPSLKGVPEGITVVEYIGNGEINAGEYTVRAVIKYDGENYNEPHIPDCKFTICKKIIMTPTPTAVYNGQPHLPSSDSELFRFEFDGLYISAGEYTIISRLNNSQNYTFENGLDYSETFFTILPKTISVTVNPVKKFLFEKPQAATYSFDDNDLIDGDSISVTQYIKDGYVYLKSENPNYILSVTPGRINRLPYLSSKGMGVLVVILLILLLLGAVAFIIYYYRKEINCFIAVLRCRWHNRTVAVFPPKETKGDLKINVDRNFEQISNDGVSDEEPFIIPIFEEPESKEENKTESIVTTSVDEDRANMLITDSLAKSLLKREGDIVVTSGSKKEMINVDTLSENFSSGDKVDINILKSRGLVPEDASNLKVLARGSIDKPLIVYANEFSLGAIKMIALTGGEAIKVVTAREKKSEE